jgi:thiamine-monophosphate kinase
MIDISDGLSTDLTHLCNASGLAAVIEAAALPIHPLALAAERSGLAESAIDLALHGGEDYELLFTAAPKVRIPRRIAGVRIHAIGAMVKPARRQALVTLRGRDGKATPLEPKGWEHFRTKK